jgi:transposase
MQAKMGRAEVLWDKVRRRWYLSWLVKTADVQSPGNKCAAVNLGVRILDSLSIEGREMALTSMAAMSSRIRTTSAGK